MRIFGPLYDRVLALSAHRHASRWLGALSFAESSFFPIPPDVMLAPMCLAEPQKAWRFAALTTAASLLGGIAGYALGYFALELVEPLLIEWGYQQGYERVQQWFRDWGVAAVLIAGFSPIPYKLFTISAGAAMMSFPGFVVASLIGRGARFFLVAGLIRWGGPRYGESLRRNVDAIGWATVVVVAAGAAFLLLRD